MSDDEVVELWSIYLLMTVLHSRAARQHREVLGGVGSQRFPCACTVFCCEVCVSICIIIVHMYVIPSCV